MLDIDAVSRWDFGRIAQAYTERDAMLYALAIGFGQADDEPAELRYVFERDLQVVPSLASVLCFYGPWYGDPRTGINVARVVHGEQEVRIVEPLPAAMEVSTRPRVTAVVDKGEGKGAVVEIVRELLGPGGDVHAEVRNVVICRDEGGCARGGSGFGHVEPLARVPARAPDLLVQRRVPANAALLFRLMGDYNPLHADPAYARAAGFPRPILHGLCIFGMATREVLRACCAHDASRLRRMSGRFSAPVFPGDEVEIRLWRDGPSRAQVQVAVPSRGLVIFDNGGFGFEPAPTVPEA